MRCPAGEATQSELQGELLGFTHGVLLSLPDLSFSEYLHSICDGKYLNVSNVVT